MATSEEMAGHLESLANHYEQMSDILRDSEAGEAFSDADIQGEGNRMLWQTKYTETS